MIKKKWGETVCFAAAALVTIVTVLASQSPAQFTEEIHPFAL